MKISVTPPKEKRALLFSSRGAVHDWASKELQFWDPWAQSLEAGPIPLQWSQARSALQAVADIGPDASDFAESAERSLKAAVTSLGITSRDARAHFVRSIAEAGEDPTVVGLTMHALTDVGQVTNLVGHNRWRIAAGQALAYRAAWLASPTARGVRDMRSALHRLHEETLQVLGGVQDKQNEADEALANFEGSATQWLADSKDEWKKVLAAFQEEHDNLREKLTVGLSLRAPVEYWADKRTRHDKSAEEYRWWFTGIAIGGLVLLAGLSVYWLIPTLLDEEGAWWALVLFSGLVALWAWPLRLTSKMYLAHSHLREDAAEREVITKTFLALGDAVEMSAEDRQLLLSALFRSSSAGLVKDDGALNITDLLVARLVGKD